MIETEALAVKQTGYYDIFNVVDLNEVLLLATHHMQNSQFANVGAGVGDGFDNTKELKVMNYKEAPKNLDGSAFQKCIRTLVGQDVHMKSYTSEQGGCQEGSQDTQKGIPDFN